MIWRREHTIIAVIKVTEVLGFSLILPFLPFYAKELGADPFQTGLVLMSFSLFQFFSAPIMGKLSDTYGRRPLLILSQLSTLVGFLILGFSKTIWMLLLSRVVDGLLGSNYTIAQAYLSDITPQKDRTKIYSFTGIAFSVGFFIGPAIGGYLAKFGYGLPSFLAAGMTAITIITTYLYLPETIKKKKKFTWSWDIFKFNDFSLLFKSPKLSIPLWEYFFYVLTHGIWVSSFALYAEKQLKFDAEATGYIFAVIGAISIVIRIFLLPKLLNLFAEKKLRIIGAISIIIALMATPLINHGYQLAIMTIFFTFGASILRPSLRSHISNQAKNNEQGKIMGIAESLGSISQIIGPAVGGYLIKNFFPGSLGLVAAGVMTIDLLILLADQKLLKKL